MSTDKKRTQPRGSWVTLAIGVLVGFTLAVFLYTNKESQETRVRHLCPDWRDTCFPEYLEKSELNGSFDKLWMEGSLVLVDPEHPLCRNKDNMDIASATYNKVAREDSSEPFTSRVWKRIEQATNGDCFGIRFSRLGKALTVANPDKTNKFMSLDGWMRVEFIRPLFGNKEIVWVYAGAIRRL
ncbi:MAG: hypothetical protein OXR68_04070 [Alphaproteobacteria bacterium]|nr:hypothetical protein [Alphaproteobacteria bacterium]MDD9919783.1 hypothetical protein [Alphaproteobacteria bacterium]